MFLRVMLLGVSPVPMLLSRRARQYRGLKDVPLKIEKDGVLADDAQNIKDTPDFAFRILMSLSVDRMLLPRQNNANASVRI